MDFRRHVGLSKNNGILVEKEPKKGEKNYLNQNNYVLGRFKNLKIILTLCSTKV
jgi:hypothetical protein